MGEANAMAPAGIYAQGPAPGAAVYGDSSYAGQTFCDQPGVPVCQPSAAPRRQWFLGLYGISLKRNQPDCKEFGYTVSDETALTTPFYPDYTVTYLNTSGSDCTNTDDRWGGEVRFGSTFGGRWSCDCHHPLAWELGYWAVEEDSGHAERGIYTHLDSTTERIYTLQNMAGLMYDPDGAGAAPAVELNTVIDFQLPVTNPGNTYRVVGLRVREDFQVQNLELNFWKFGTPSCSSPLLGGRLGSACGLGNGCRPPRRFFINGLCGFRYMKIDNDLYQDYRVAPTTAGGSPTGGTTSFDGWYSDANSIFHDIETDNRLYGFQLGASMNWLVGSKWNVFADTNFGVYKNDIDVCQWVYSPGDIAEVTYDTTGYRARTKSSEEEIAFAGEARIGVGYQLTCNLRATAAYRVIAVSGIATAVGQIPAHFANADMVSYIHSNESLFMQGVQTGLEWKY